MERQRTRIYLIRHGEVENPREIRYGRLPGFHLSATGRDEIAATARHFADKPIACIYTSPLERTQQTATIIGRVLPKVEIKIDARLTEVQIPPSLLGKHRDRPYEYQEAKTEHSETPTDIAARMRHFMEEKIVAHHGGEIIAVSHGDPISIFRNWEIYNNFSPEYHFYPAYGSITEFVFTGLQLAETWYWRKAATGAKRT